MKIKTNVKYTPVTELKIELTKEDIEEIQEMCLKLEMVDADPFGEEYEYRLFSLVETDKQIKLVKKFLKALSELYND